ncbi:MAG: tol-pal system protein YbgF [Chromatiaceae bacterium]|nr:tol-pal system protein YbgF [Chromatiaceae bacterium]MCP5436322.1 tol-pal system protein YbgF [Chromatiaceae bacterium]MCW5586229.1 tol-pal system protein YbgF [Chromatiales bacterium]HOP16580.1 tol-pal system protein YbgF [Gammaproteobacteria bacterium]
MTLRLVSMLVIALLPVFAPAAELTTAQRLELLERRVNRITELTMELDEVRRENRQLRGSIESLGNEIEQLKRKQRDIYIDMDQRLSAGQGADEVAAPAVAASVAAQAGTSAPVERAVAAVDPARVDRAQVQAEYQAAYDLLSPQQKRYEDAAKAFAVFLQKYPQDELAPNAQYWLGESHYVSQHNAEALQAFEVVVSRYPDSTKAPGALFKIGRLQQAAGNNDAARASYEKVLRDYPDSPAAGLARQRLEQSGR